MDMNNHHLDERTAAQRRFELASSHSGAHRSRSIGAVMVSEPAGEMAGYKYARSTTIDEAGLPNEECSKSVRWCVYALFNV